MVSNMNTRTKVTRHTVPRTLILERMNCVVGSGIGRPVAVKLHAGRLAVESDAIGYPTRESPDPRRVCRRVQRPRQGPADGN